MNDLSHRPSLTNRFPAFLLIPHQGSDADDSMPPLAERKSAEEEGEEKISQKEDTLLMIHPNPIFLIPFEMLFHPTLTLTICQSPVVIARREKDESENDCRSPLPIIHYSLTHQLLDDQRNDGVNEWTTSGDETDGLPDFHCHRNQNTRLSVRPVYEDRQQ